MATDYFNFETECSELLKTAITRFAEWAAANWTMTPAEAETLTNPTEAPAIYARGYCDAIKSIPDAAELWLSEGQYE